MRFHQKIRKACFPIQRLLCRGMRQDVWMGGPPAGMFTEEADLLAAKVRGQVIPKPEFPEIPEDSEVSKAGLGQNKHSNWVCLWTCRDNAFLAAPSLAHVDCTGRVCLEAVYGPHAWSDPVWQRKRKLPIRELAGDFTSIISRWNLGGNYYHWFLDGLTRLIHLQDFPMDCRILIPRRPPAFVRRSIELLGLANRVVETGDEDLRIERYWFAGPTMLSGCPDPLGVRWLRRKFLREPQPARRRLLYLERNATTRIVINAAEVRRFFACRGWEILDPGELSLDEQIRLFREAKAVVGPHGAALTNLLWAAPGTRVLEFMPARRRNGCYAGISLLTGLAHRTLVCPSDRDANIHAPMERLAEWENRMRSGLDAG